MAKLEITRTPEGPLRLKAEQVIPRPLDEVFAFFQDPSNLERLTPAYLQFSIVTPQPIEMKQGALIDYKLRVHGIPMRWRSKIHVWNPPYAFSDTQVKGPYLLWDHLHSFREVADGTLVEDRVFYVPPFGRLLNDLLVERDVRGIFAFRMEELKRVFADAREPACV